MRPLNLAAVLRGVVFPVALPLRIRFVRLVAIEPFFAPAARTPLGGLRWVVYIHQFCFTSFEIEQQDNLINKK